VLFFPEDAAVRSICSSENLCFIFF